MGLRNAATGDERAAASAKRESSTGSTHVKSGARSIVRCPAACVRAAADSSERETATLKRQSVLRHRLGSQLGYWRPQKRNDRLLRASVRLARGYESTMIGMPVAIDFSASFFRSTNVNRSQKLSSLPKAYS